MNHTEAASKFTFSRRVSYALAATALLVVVKCGLAAALVAGLSTLLVLTRTRHRLAALGAGPGLARGGAIAIFLVIAAALLGVAIAFARAAMARLPILLDALLPRLSELAQRFGADLPIDSPTELKSYILDAARTNAHLLTAEGGLLTRGFFEIVVAVAAALLAPLDITAPTARAERLDQSLGRECAARVARFVTSFELVMGAQVAISAINTVVTAAFLFGFGVPFRTVLLVATFFLGLVPLVGNLASNVLVVGAALTVSGSLALAATAFLVISHEAQFFLNGRFVGGRIDTPTWAILLGLLLGETLMGVPGAILAPALIHYAREEMRARPAA